MPGYARNEIVRNGQIGIYHTWSRCVQKAFLCGRDPETNVDFDYRRDWIKSLLEYQASVFAVDLGNYSILSNHQHLIARTRPDIAAKWTDEEVAWRWKLAWPAWKEGKWVREPTDEEIEKELARPERLLKLRANLSSLSWFMARWKEPIARLANAEMDRRGHFYEQRFGSREIMDDAANLCCNIYVDMNQIKAGMATRLEDCRCSAIQDRLKAWRKEQAQASLEAFNAKGQTGFALEVEQIEQLLADCFLAPIGDQGPPLLDHASIPSIVSTTPSVSDTLAPATESLLATSPNESSKQEIADSLPAEPVEEPSAVSSDSADPNASPVSANAAGIPATPPAVVPQQTAGRRRGRPARSRPVPTRKIHERLRSRRRKRASDNVYLGIPKSQYLELVSWTAENWLASQSDSGSSTSRPPPDSVATILQQWGIAPAFWCEAIAKFDSWFRRAVGHADRLKERSKNHWLQGIRRCRQVYT